MNMHLEKVDHTLANAPNFNRFVLNTTMPEIFDKRLNRMLENGEIKELDCRRFKYFFRCQAAINELIMKSVEGFRLEVSDLLATNLSIRKKKNRLNEISVLFHDILFRDVLKGGKQDFSRYEILDKKIKNANGLQKRQEFSSTAFQIMMDISKDIDSGKIIMEDDLAKKWSEHLAKKWNDFVPKTSSADANHKLTMPLKELEIREYHLLEFKYQWSNLMEKFISSFSSKFKFSFDDVVRGKIVEVREPVPKIDASIKNDIFRILKEHITPDSQEDLQKLLGEKSLSNPIKFLGFKEELMSVFLFLYTRNKITPSPTNIGVWVSKSFVVVRPPRNIIQKLNPERVREFISGAKDNDRYKELPEITKLRRKYKLSV